MDERGALEEEVIEAIRTGEESPAKKGRKAYRKNFQYNSYWSKKFYHIKQVVPVVVEESDIFTVITVYTFYF